MTKIPWRGKETKASHEVFIATKPGECVSVDQMASTEVGFFNVSGNAFSDITNTCVNADYLAPSPMAVM